MLSEQGRFATLLSNLYFVHNRKLGRDVLNLRQNIEEGESVLIVTQDVPADELASQRKFRIDLQQAIELP